MNETQRLSERRENPPRPRDADVARRLACWEWKARMARECGQAAREAGDAQMAASLEGMARKSQDGMEALRAWAKTASALDAAGVDTAFLGDLDPEALARLPESAFAQARRTCPDLDIPGRPRPIAAATPVPEPETPAKAETRPEAPKRATFSPAPTIVPDIPKAAPVIQKAQEPVRPAAVETPPLRKTSQETKTAPRRVRPDALAPEKPDATTVIDYDIRRLTKGAAPFDGAQVVRAAEKYGVPPEMLAAFARNDSRYGTRGPGSTNHNPCNVGQYDHLKKAANGYEDWDAGLEAGARNLASRIRKYRDATGRDDWGARELATGRTRDGEPYFIKRKDQGAYMTEKTGPATVETIYAQLTTGKIRGAPWTQGAAA